MKEIWKDIGGYEGLYQVSNLGNVRSIDRKITDKRGYVYLKKGKILSKGIISLGKGYVMYNLWKENKIKRKLAHRLVAEAFIENPYNKNEVNHKDLNSMNNNVNNLEWCTHKANVDYSVVRDMYKTKLSRGKVIEIATYKKSSL